jgi:hypothetical protein
MKKIFLVIILLLPLYTGYQHLESTHHQANNDAKGKDIYFG